MTAALDVAYSGIKAGFKQTATIKWKPIMAELDTKYYQKINATVFQQGIVAEWKRSHAIESSSGI